MKELVLNTAAINLPEADIGKYRIVLESSFAHHKVSQLAQRHRLRQVWTRDDWLATIEKLTLAHAIETMSSVDQRWTQKHIGKICGKNGNELIGSVFELLCGTMIFDAGLNPKPGRKNSPGYDLELVYPDDHRVFLSLKNHDMSSFEEEFRKRCKQFQKQMRTVFEASSLHPFIMIESSRLPSEADWALLEKYIAGVNKLDKELSINEPCEGIALGCMELRPIPGIAFAAKPISSQLMVLSKFHKNEQDNFVSKLEDAAHNMRDKLGRQTNSSNVVCMRVNPTASIEYLEGFAKEFLESDDDHGIDGVIFYQPSVIRKPDNTSVVQHFTKRIGSKRWDPGKHPVAFRPFIGIPANSPSRTMMQGDGQPLLDNVQGYFFQEGDIYQQFVLKEGTQTLSNPAPGIRFHLAIGDGSALSGKLFSEQEDLLLL